MNKKLNKEIAIVLLLLFIIAIPICIFGFLALNSINNNIANDENIIIKNCPICGREVDLIEESDGSYYITCKINDMEGGCGLRTGLYNDKTILVTIWNELCEANQK